MPKPSSASDGSAESVNEDASQQAAPAISPRVFANFQKFIYEETGIWLGPSKTALLCGRLSRRLRALRLSTLEQYFELVTQPGQHEEFVLMINAITTNETHFFRESSHFEFLVQSVFPQWRREAELHLRAPSIRVWSAGCSSGEEPYSLAMLLLQHFPPQSGWDVEVLATDISTQVMAKAREGIYSLEKSGEIPGDLLKSFMLKGVGAQEGHMKVSPELQKIVRFTRLNLIQAPYPVAGNFDVIFCRNVLIYFDADSKKRVVETLTGHLSTRGLLFLGHAENLNGVTNRLRTLAPTIYRQVAEDGQFLSSSVLGS